MKRISLLLLAVIGCQAADKLYLDNTYSAAADTVLVVLSGLDSYS